MIIIRRIIIALAVPLLIFGALNWRLIETMFISPPPRPVDSVVMAELTERQPDNTLTIPSLGVTAPLLLSMSDPTRLRDWPTIRAELTKGVSMAGTLARPGDPGITVVTGHSSDWWPHKYAAVFARLDRLKEDDIIQVKQDGLVYRYNVRQTNIVPPDSEIFQPEHLQQLTARNQLYLVTCWPRLTTAKRLVVMAEYAGEQTLGQGSIE